MSRWIALVFALLLAAGAWWLVRTAGRSAGTVGPSSGIEGAVAPFVPADEGLQPEDGRRDVAPEPTQDRVTTDAQPSPAPEGAEIELLVLDEGRPLAGARVRTFEDSRPGEHLTDRDGVCRLPIAPSDETMRLSVEAEGFFHFNALRRRLPELTVELAVAATLTGRLLDAEQGFPLPNAWLELRHDSCDGCEPQRAVAGEGNRFALSPVPLDRRMELRLGAVGYPSDDAVLRLHGERAQEHDFRLERGLGVSGQVVDLLSGNPLEGAEIWNVRRGLAHWRADEAGRFSARLLECPLMGSIELEIESEGYCRLRASIDPDEIPEGEELRFPLLRGASFAGVVLDEEGEPVVGAEVSPLGPSEWNRSHGAPDPNPLDELPPGWHYWPRCDWVERATDAQGCFDSGPCLPGSGAWRLRVRHPPHLEQEIEVEQLGAPGETTWLEVRLELAPPTGIVSGSLVANGAPRSGRIHWSGPTRSGSSPVGPDGLYRIGDVEAGRVELRARPYPLDPKDPPSPRAVVALELSAGGEVHHDFELELELTSISGSVRATSGEPMAGVRMSARRRGWFNALNAETAEDGGYAIEVSATGMLYDVSASLPPQWERRDDVSAGAENVDFVLGGVGRLPYRPVDADTGELVQPCDLYWRPAGGRSYKQLFASGRAPDTEGWSEVEAPAGSLDFMARADWHGYRPLVVRGYTIPAEGRAEPLVLELERGLEVELQLGEGFEAPPKDAIAVLVEADAWEALQYEREGGSRGLDGTERYPGLTVWRRRLYFDASGRAKLIGLSPGPHRFKVFPPDIAIEPETLELTGEERNPILIRWRWMER